MNKADRKYEAFRRSAGWNIAVDKPPKVYVIAAAKKHVQSKLRTMTDAEVDRLLK